MHYVRTVVTLNNKLQQHRHPRHEEKTISYDGHIAIPRITSECMIVATAAEQRHCCNHQRAGLLSPPETGYQSVTDEK